MANTVQEALQTAIMREAAAFELYTSTADLVNPGPARDLLLDLAGQERGHRRRLENLRAKGAFARLTPKQQEQVLDLKITDHLVAVPLSRTASLQDILTVAGQREAASHALYTGLAELSEDERMRSLFEFLATEELKHKQAVEKLYEDLFLPEN